ncbi:hypothetical protein [Streptomyces mutabilis]|uniref:hypothetical protein n=1 Tax=Streptomyces mutabilis TaxID=67332 RepID=UPI002FD38745
MRALTVRPGEKDSLEVREVPDSVPADGELLVRGLAVGGVRNGQGDRPGRVRLGPAGP